MAKKELPTKRPIKEVVATAKAYLAGLLQDEGISDIALEEIGYDTVDGVWSVTLGFLDPRGGHNSVLGIFPPGRKLKVVKIDNASGEPISLSIREAA